MTDDKKLFEKIAKVIAAKDKAFEAEAEAAAGEDAEIIEKIQVMMEKAEDILENLAEKVESVKDEVIEEMKAEEAPEIEEEPIAEEETPAVEEEPIAEEETPAVEEEAIAEEKTPAVEEEPISEEETPEIEEEPVAEEKPLPVPPTGEHRKSFATAVEEKFKAWNPKSKVGKFFAKDRHNAMLGATLALALVTGGAVFADYMIPQNVEIEYSSFTEDDAKIAISSRANTTEGILEDAGIEIGEHDYVYPSSDYKVKSGDTIIVKKAVETKAEIIGEEQTFYLIPGTSEENLTFNGVNYDEDDMMSPAKGSEVAADTHIVFKEVHFTTEEKQEKVAAKSVVVLDPTLYSGKVARTEGHDGEGIFTYKTTYVNGVATGTSKEVKEWITEPVDNALRLGTSLTGHTGTYTVTKTFTANTTAYYMGENARGAAGGRCVYGTCAVDPSVFPYGTLFFVEGYGVAVANDCGGAVKGNILDLWMHSYNESCQWGRRYVTAYVLK